jgi:hypothetical protein
MSCFQSPLSVIKSAFMTLEPGGYLELQDCVAPWTSVDGTFAGTKLQKFHQMTIDGAKFVGRDVCQVVRYKSFFEEAGFVDVKEVFYCWPLGAWAMVISLLLVYFRIYLKLGTLIYIGPENENHW